MFNEHDCVKIVKLLTNNRHFDGTENIKRSPKVGDEGTVVNVIAENYTVECVDSDGLTVWLADFVVDEIEGLRIS